MGSIVRAIDLGFGHTKFTTVNAAGDVRYASFPSLALASVVLLFVVAVVLHSRMYDLRPPASQLTLFYFVMSAGGALGGMFTALIAPVVFDWVWEHRIEDMAKLGL